MTQYKVYVNGRAFDVVVEVAGAMPQPSMNSISPQAPVTMPQTPVYTPAPQAPTYAPVAQAPTYTPPLPVTPVAAPATAETRVLSPLPGVIWAIPVSVGDTVTEGQCLIVVEAMKMENDIVAPVAGVVKQILVSKGASVNPDDVLVVLG